jgi:tetratricopeptide (TPR) repeat protein
MSFFVSAFSKRLSVSLKMFFGAAGVSMCFFSPVMAQDQKAKDLPEQRPAPLQTLSQDELLSRLAKASTEREAKLLSAQIEKRWSRSGSDTADLLMKRAGLAMIGEDAALAAELAEKALVLAPNWAEGWSRRAFALYALDDRAGALKDLERALSLEPRHYTSLTALGHIMSASEQPKKALSAYRRAKALHPFLSELDTRINRLKPDVEGRDL